jgi:hypothetical protein
MFMVVERPGFCRGDNKESSIRDCNGGKEEKYLGLVNYLDHERWSTVHTGLHQAASTHKLTN